MKLFYGGTFCMQHAVALFIGLWQIHYINIAISFKLVVLCSNVVFSTSLCALMYLLNLKLALIYKISSLRMRFIPWSFVFQSS